MPSLYSSGAFSKLIDVFNESMNKESILYLSVLEHISDT